MAKKSFLLVSLKEKKAKKIAEVIQNKTCRKILDFMSNHEDVTEGKIAKSLKIPVSTVHYNMKQLILAKLVKSEEYHYSEKGKEVSHYCLANQYVIIAPEGDKSLIREKLKSIIPTALVIGAASAIIKIFSPVIQEQNTFATKMANIPQTVAVAESVGATAKTVAADTVQKAFVATPHARTLSEPAADTIKAEVTNQTIQRTTEITNQTIPSAINLPSQFPEIALWFAIGAVSSIIIYLLFEMLFKKLKK